MPVFRKIACALLALPVCLSLMSAADTVQKSPTRKAHSKKAKEQAATLPPYTPRTLSQLPLEQVPAVPPQVAYDAGQLTIVAQNSTLGDILRAVHAQTGAELDVPPSANERVVATLGPGPARDVLATLLNGTHFNYVLLGSAANPTAVQRVVLTAKTGPETTTASAAPVPPQQGMAVNRFQQPMSVPQAQNVEPEAPTDDNSADAQDDSSETPDDQQADQQQQNPGQAPKTPEQLLQELQRQQQQMQQQQMQQQQMQQQQQPGQQGPPQIVYPNPPTAQPENQN